MSFIVTLPTIGGGHNSFRCDTIKADVLANGNLVGFVTFKPLTGVVAKVGYEIFEPHRGNGFATQAVRELITWAWQRGFVQLLTGVRSDNKPSIGVLFKNGFRVDYTTKEDDGTYYQCRLEQHWDVDARSAYWVGE